MEFNINYKIMFKLTPKGEETLEKIKENHNKEYPEFLFDNYYTINENGYMVMQLWRFMSLFGPYFYNGAPQIIVDNTIIMTETKNTDSGYALKNSEGKYFIGMNQADTQLRKAKIYHSAKYATDSMNDVNRRLPGAVHDFDLVKVEIKEVIE